MEKFREFDMKLAETCPNAPSNPAQKTLVQSCLNQWFSEHRTPDHPPYSAKGDAKKGEEEQRRQEEARRRHDEARKRVAEEEKKRKYHPKRGGGFRGGGSSFTALSVILRGSCSDATRRSYHDSMGAIKNKF